MATKLEREIAQSLDAPPELLKYLPELLADLEALGGSPNLVAELLRPLGLPRSTRALDLGCGKGAAAIRLAKEFGFEVLGVDGFAPFIAEARRRAAEEGVAGLCRFRCADVREILHSPVSYDLVIFAGLGTLLGDQADTVGKLRSLLRPGGFLILDDACLAESAGEAFPAYQGYAGHEETLRRLAAHGDRLLKEIIIPVSEVRETNRRNTGRIRERAVKLARRHPEDRELILNYVQAQETESARLETALMCAVWLLQRLP